MKSGVAFSDRLYLAGIECFCSLLSNEILEEFDIPLLDQESQAERNEFSEDSDEENDSTLEIEFKASAMEENTSDLMVDFDFNDCLYILREKMESVVLPAPYSQSGLNEYRGSSACTVIALVTGCVFSQEQFKSSALNSFIKAFVGCIDFGNSLHPEAHYLSAFEGIMKLPNNVKLFAFEEKDYFPEDFKKKKNIISQFSLMSEKVGFVLFTVNGKTACVVKDENLYCIFDSHCYEPDMGAAILRCEQRHLDIVPAFFLEFRQAKINNENASINTK